MMAASAKMNNDAQKSVVGARENAMRVELERQRALRERAAAVNDETEARFTRQQQDQSTGQEADRRTQVLQEAVALPTSGIQDIPVAGAPAIVQSQIAASIRDALLYGKKLAGANARLGAYGSNQFNNGLTLNRSAQDLGQVSDFSRRSSDITGMELESANQAGAKQRQMADLFRMGGSLVAMYGGTGAGVGTQAPAPVEDRNPSGVGLRQGGGQGLRL